MEESAKDQLSAPGSKGGSLAPSKLLRYPLRTASKSKEEKPAAAVEPFSSSAPRRGRPTSNVSKSVSVLELSGKEKSAKPLRRLSIPTKSTATPAPKTVGSITPISEVRAKQSVGSQNKSETPTSDASRSVNRKRFCVLSSSSYWLTQIKQSELAGKHSISLGFFKLALEAGCDQIPRMRDELKSYARRHNLAEFGESAKELLASYNIMENVEQLQVSESCSQVPEEGTRSSDDDAVSSSSVAGTRKLKPKCLNTDPTSPVKGPSKGTAQKTTPVSRIRGVSNKKPAKASSALEAGTRKTQKNSQKPSNIDSGKLKQSKNQKKSANEEDSIYPSPAEESCEQDKENMDVLKMEEISLAEV